MDGRTDGQVNEWINQLVLGGSVGNGLRERKADNE